MSYYDNKKAQEPLTKEDFKKAFNAMKSNNNGLVERSPIFYLVPPDETIKRFNLDCPTTEERGD